MKYSDAPISKKDDDELNRRPLANELAMAISQYDLPQSYVLGINGKWGDGKTSLINLCHQELIAIDNDSVEVIYFNPWYFTGEDQILKQFCNALAKHISTPQGTRKALKETADKIIKIAGCIKPFKEVANIAGLTLGFPLLGNIMDCSADNAVKYAQSVSKGLESKDDITELKTQIGKELTETNKKFVIVVDDIDRLQDDEVSEVFRLVKVVADFSNTIYLLAYDRDQVASALSKNYHNDGEKFIEKIIQQEILINHVTRDALNKYLLNEIGKIAANPNEEERTRFTEIWQGLSLAFSNVRDVKRFLNSYQFLYTHTKNEVNPIDLMAVVALQIKAPKHHKFLRENAFIFINRKTDVAVALWSDFISKNGGDTDWRSLLLNSLLPSASTTSKLDNSGIAKERLFESPKHFERYFTFTVPEGETTEAEYKIIMNLTSEDEISSHFTESEEKGMLGDLLEGMRLRSPNFEAAKIPNFIISLFAVANKSKEEKGGMFGLDAGDKAFSLARKLLDQILDSNIKKDTLEKVFAWNDDSLFIQVRLLDYLGQDFGYVKQRGKHTKINNEEIFLTQHEFELLKAQCLVKLSNLNFLNHLKNNYFVALCYDLESWGDNNILAKIRQQISALPDDLLHYAELSQSRVFSTGPKQKYDAFRMRYFKFLTDRDDWTEESLIIELKAFEESHPERFLQIMTAIEDEKF